MLKTRAYPLCIEIVVDEIDNISSEDCFGCIIQYPGKKETYQILINFYQVLKMKILKQSWLLILCH